MADDKGGGGKSWEPFEIILVILLLVGFLTQLQTGSTKSNTAVKPTQKNALTVKKPASLPVSETDTTPDTCGLQIVRPHSLEKVGSFVTLSGTTNGCDWVSNADTALFAQVIDSNGKPISAYIAVPPTTFVSTMVTFDTTISLDGQPDHGVGYLILVSAKNSNDHTTTLRIPLTFSAQ